MAISIVLASGSPRSPVDVLAEVYAATAPQAGVVESIAVIRSNPGTPHRSTEHLREWLQASAGRRRAIITRSDPHGRTSVDVAYSPGTWEAWGAGAADEFLPFTLAAHNTIERVRFTGQPARTAPSGLLGEQWAKTFHSGYLRHQFLVAGKVRRHGELLWKLVETPARVRARAREDQTSYYALVDPHSFLPVYTRLSDVARPGHPAITEVELLSLRRLPASAAGAGLFDLEQAHPGARVVVQTVPRRATVEEDAGSGGQLSGLTALAPTPAVVAFAGRAPIALKKASRARRRRDCGEKRFAARSSLWPE